MAKKKNTVSRSAVADLRKRRRETAALVGIEAPTGGVRRADREGRLSVRTFANGVVYVTHATHADLVGTVEPGAGGLWAAVVFGQEPIILDNRKAALRSVAVQLAATERFGPLTVEEMALIVDAPEAAA